MAPVVAGVVYRATVWAVPPTTWFPEIDAGPAPDVTQFTPRAPFARLKLSVDVTGATAVRVPEPVRVAPCTGRGVPDADRAPSPVNAATPVVGPAAGRRRSRRLIHGLPV